MKTIQLIVFLLLGSASFAAVDQERFLKAIRDVETGDRNVRGKAGELSAYQFTKRCWSQQTNQPFRRASEPEFAHEVAKRHLNWLERELGKERKSIDAYTLALCWNQGLSATVKGKTAKRGEDYATRVNNLYNSSKK